MSKRGLADISGPVESQTQVKRRIDPGLRPLSPDNVFLPSLAYPRTNEPARKQIPFQQPTQLISYSHGSTHELEWSDSGLRYFVNPPLGADLNYAYERWMKRPETKPRLDGLLQAVQKLTERQQLTLSDIGVISWRGVMTRILTAPYESYDSWEVNVMSVNNTLFFEEHVTDGKLKEKENMEPRHRKQTYYGYAFESYCTADSPAQSPPTQNGTGPIGWSGDVNTNVQWCSVVRTKLGSTRLVIGGEVDCVREKYTHQPNTFVELKTSLTIRNNADEAKFEKKLLKFYFQSFLLGVPVGHTHRSYFHLAPGLIQDPQEIVVGFRTPSGILTTTQSFKTIQIPRMVRGKPGAWDPSICLEWGSQFLSFLNEETQERASDQDRTVWRVKFVPKSGISITVLDSSEVEDVMDGEDRVGFLPRQFWEEIHIGEEHDTEKANRGLPITPAASSEPGIAGWQL